MNTTRLSLLDDESRRAVTCFYECLLHDNQLGGGETKEGVLALVILNGGGLSIPERFWTHRCCQCQCTGAVIHRSLAGPSLPIDWTCRVCDRYVCHNCTLTVPGSVPLRFREETLCSEECWKKIGSPREEEEEAESQQQTADSFGSGSGL